MTIPIRAKISALGSYLPPRVLTNADLEKMVDTTDEWIQQRTGMRERRIVGHGETTATLASAAAKKALDNAGVAAADIDLIVVCTLTPDMLTP